MQVLKVVLVLALVGTLNAAPAPVASAAGAAAPAATADGGKAPADGAASGSPPANPQVHAMGAPHLITAPAFLPTHLYLRCSIDVETGSATNPFVGTEAWWAKNIPVMQAFFQRCEMPQTRVSLQFSDNGATPDFNVPPNVPIRFEISPEKEPFAFIPFYHRELENLPGNRLFGSLICNRIWTKGIIKLKLCDVSNTNAYVAPAPANAELTPALPQ